MTALTAAVHACLAAIVSRDLADDLVRAVTFGGSYRPCVGVMQNRNRNEWMDRVPSIASVIRADVYVYGSDTVGFRDNRDTVQHSADLEMLAGVLRFADFQVRAIRTNGRVSALRVKPSKASIAAVEAAAPLYIARIDAAMALAES